MDEGEEVVEVVCESLPGLLQGVVQSVVAGRDLSLLLLLLLLLFFFSFLSSPPPIQLFLGGLGEPKLRLKELDGLVLLKPVKEEA